MLLFVWWIVVIYLVWCYFVMVKVWNEGIVMCVIVGFLIFVLFWLVLNILCSVGYGELIYFGFMFIFVVLGIVWSVDIGVYFIGKNLGKYKLMLKVSLNKIIEGLFGGVVVLVIFVLVFCYYSNVDMVVWLIYVIMIVFIVLFLVVGDLLESMFKCEVGLKDSGLCLLGYGGILDCIDSLIVVVLIFVFCYVWILSL